MGSDTQKCGGMPWILMALLNNFSNAMVYQDTSPSLYEYLTEQLLHIPYMMGFPIEKLCFFSLISACNLTNFFFQLLKNCFKKSFTVLAPMLFLHSGTCLNSNCVEGCNKQQKNCQESFSLQQQP